MSDNPHFLLRPPAPFAGVLACPLTPRWPITGALDFGGFQAQVLRCILPQAGEFAWWRSRCSFFCIDVYLYLR